GGLDGPPRAPPRKLRDCAGKPALERRCGNSLARDGLRGVAALPSDRRGGFAALERGWRRHTARRRTMANKGTMLVGTIGQGVMKSGDDGEAGSRAGRGQGMQS